MTGVESLVAVAIVAIAAAIGWSLAHRRAPPPRRQVVAAPPPPSPPQVSERPRARVRTARAAGGAGLALRATALACPSCRREYEGVLYCTQDARRLVPAYELHNHPRSQGVVCLACRRAFEPGIRRCPHDGTSLVPFAVFAATRPRGRASEAAGVIARICPVCGTQYDLHARFCGADGSELVVIN